MLLACCYPGYHLVVIRSLLGWSSKRVRLVNTVLGVVMKRTHVLRLLLHLNTIFETLRAKDTFTILSMAPVS